LIFRLVDTKDLVISLKPFAEGKIKNEIISKTDAKSKIKTLQAEVAKIETSIKLLSNKHGI